MAAYPTYREIQPAIQPPDDPTTPPQISSQTTFDTSKQCQYTTARSRRRNATAACESCRKRKTRCSAERPRCTVCVAKGFECNYNAQPSESRISALKRTHAEMEYRSGCLESIVSALRSLPETKAHDILKSIRSGAPIQDILHQLEVESTPGDIAPTAT
ncbi:C6 transcription factor [Colletotrichum graminicola]|nr:C6 transcription factor [Colletotrichum graminicola]